MKTYTPAQAAAYYTVCLRAMCSHQEAFAKTERVFGKELASEASAQLEAMSTDEAESRSDAMLRESGIL